jgi:hypothetical protein
LIRFARWLRKNYDFPVRVPVYLFPSEYIFNWDREKISASFFAPFCRHEEPYIRIATGDYESLKAERGRDNALASFLCSLAHEIVHYQQWITTGTTWERGVIVKSDAIMRRYSKTRNRP